MESLPVSAIKSEPATTPLGSSIFPPVEASVAIILVSPVTGSTFKTESIPAEPPSPF